MPTALSILRKDFCKFMLRALCFGLLVLIRYRGSIWEWMCSLEINLPSCLEWWLETTRTLAQILLSTLSAFMAELLMSSATTCLQRGYVNANASSVGGPFFLSSAKCHNQLGKFNESLPFSMSNIPFWYAAYIERHPFSSFWYPFAGEEKMNLCSQGPMYFRAGLESVFSWTYCSLFEDCADDGILIDWIERFVHPIVMDAGLLKESVRNHSAVLLRGEDCKLILANHACYLVTLMSYIPAFEVFLLAFFAIQLPFLMAFKWILDGAYPEIADRINHAHVD